MTIPLIHNSPSMNGTDQITETPGSGTSTNTATAVSASVSATGQATVTISVPQPLAVACAANTATTSVPYSSAVAASGGTGPYTFALTSGSLPPGFSLDPSTGAIAGTTAKTGTYSYTVTVTDSSSATAPTSGCSIVVSALTALKATFPSGPPATGKVGAGFNASVTATGGAGPYTFSLTTGSLPPGLTLNTSTGAITGIPTTAGKYTATVTVTDSINETATASGTITINPPPALKATFPGGPAANGKVGTAYSQKITVTGGAGSYTFSLTSGSLPPGLTLDTSAGSITGTPTTAGKYTATVTVTDSYSDTATASGTITINP